MYTVEANWKMNIILKTGHTTGRHFNIHEAKCFITLKYVLLEVRYR